MFEAPDNAPWFRVIPPEDEERRKMFREEVGPRSALKLMQSQLHNFQYFHHRLLRHIVTETNRYML